MECPYCHKEMRPGYIPGWREAVKWMPAGVDPSLPTKEAVPLTHTPFVTPAEAEAHYCADCRVIILPVHELENRWNNVKEKWKYFTDMIGEAREARDEQRAEKRREKSRERRRKKDPWEV
ncbi:MAG: hypothetical protein E7426_00775 [Ruminococcaceae bacterium]|jgi:hypothetical protein|nr:hypothetical protein [Oscillospiraceae bacterium]